MSMGNKWLFGIGLMVMLIAMQGHAYAWADSDYSHYKEISVGVASGGFASGYQVPLNVSYGSDMQADFDDIRFYASDDSTPLDYWLESKVDSVYANVWVEMNEAVVSDSNVTIYMYYGNSSVSSGSSGGDTWILYDDFSDGNYNADPTWTVLSGTWDASSGYLQGTGGGGATIQIQTPLTAAYNISSWVTWKLSSVATTEVIFYEPIWKDANTRIGPGYWNAGNQRLRGTVGGSGTDGPDTTWSPDTDWHTTHITRDQNNLYTLYLDGDSEGTRTDNNQTSNVKFNIASYQTAATHYYDNIRVGYFHNPEPAGTFGAEQNSSGVVIHNIEPVSGEWHDSNSVLFNGTITVTGNNAHNLTMWNNATSWSAKYYETFSDSNTYEQNSTTLTIVDGDYIYSFYGCDDAGNCAWATEGNYTFYVDTTSPTVSFNTPTANYTTTANLTWFYVNASISETPSSCILHVNDTDTNYTMTIDGTYCYYNYTGGTNATEYAFYVFANDSAGNSVQSDTYSVLIDLYNQGYVWIYAYDEDTLALIHNWTATFQFSGNPQYDYGVNSSYVSVSTEAGNRAHTSPQNVYDGDLSTYSTYYGDAAGNTSSIGWFYLGDSNQICFTWSRTNDAAGAFSYVLYAQDSGGSWNVIGSNASITGAVSQTTDCFDIDNTDYNDMVLANVTLRINAAANSQYFRAHEVHGVELNSNWGLKVNVTNLDAGTNTIRIDDGNGAYYYRNYYVSLSARSNTSLNAYLVPTTSSTVLANFYAVNTYGVALSGVTVSLQKYISSSYVTIAQGLTDSSGLTSIYLIEGDTYRVLASYDGTEVVYGTITAQAQTYTITFNTSLSIDFDYITEGISLRILPNVVVYNSSSPTNTTFSMTISSNESTLDMYGFGLYCNGTTLIYQNNVTGSPAGGSIEVSYLPTSCANMTMWYYFETASGDYNNTAFWVVGVSYPYGLAQAVELARTNLDSSTMIFIMIVAMVMVGGLVAIVNPDMGAVAMLTVAGIFLYANVLEWSYFLIMCIGVFGFLIAKRRLV